MATETRRRIAPIPIEAVPVIEQPVYVLEDLSGISPDSLADVQPLGPTRRMRVDLKPIINDDDPFNVIDLREVRSDLNGLTDNL